ncbi:MAG TPA: DUF3617 domain-containing protein [Acidobacteriaceae bacterium]
MISRLALRATLPLLFSFAALASAQSDLTPPPMKMGLWQNDVTVQMSGMPNGVNMPPRTVSSQSCLTPDTWKDAIHNMQGRRQNLEANCSNANIQQDGHHYTADVTCSGQQGITTAIHVDMQFDSDESMHGTTSATMSGGNIPQGMSMNSTIKSKFLGSDCGDVKPGQGRMLSSPGGAPPS